MQTVETIPKLKPRAADAHKGDFGKVCIIAGSVGMSGAAALAGRSALRAGADAAGEGGGAKIREEDREEGGGGAGGDHRSGGNPGRGPAKRG